MSHPLRITYKPWIQQLEEELSLVLFSFPHDLVTTICELCREENTVLCWSNDLSNIAIGSYVSGPAYLFPRDGSSQRLIINSLIEIEETDFTFESLVATLLNTQERLASLEARILDRLSVLEERIQRLER